MTSLQPTADFQVILYDALRGLGTWRQRAEVHAGSAATSLHHQQGRLNDMWNARIIAHNNGNLPAFANSHRELVTIPSPWWVLTIVPLPAEVLKVFWRILLVSTNVELQMRSLNSKYERLVDVLFRTSFVREALVADKCAIKTLAFAHTENGAVWVEELSNAMYVVTPLSQFAVMTVDEPWRVLIALPSEVRALLLENERAYATIGAFGLPHGIGEVVPMVSGESGMHLGVRCQAFLRNPFSMVRDTKRSSWLAEHLPQERLLYVGPDKSSLALAIRFHQETAVQILLTRMERETGPLPFWPHKGFEAMLDAKYHQFADENHILDMAFSERFPKVSTDMRTLYRQFSSAVIVALTCGKCRMPARDHILLVFDYLGPEWPVPADWSLLYAAETVHTGAAGIAANYASNRIAELASVVKTKPPAAAAAAGVGAMAASGRSVNSTNLPWAVLVQATEAVAPVITTILPIVLAARVKADASLSATPPANAVDTASKTAAFMKRHLATHWRIR